MALNKNENYIYLKSIENFISIFDEFCVKKNTKSCLLNNSKIYLFFEFFNTSVFKRAYFSLVNDLFETLKLDKNKFLIQKTPTPRIHETNAKGADLHCDYWYGHGKDTKTVWIPLANIKKGNVIRVLSEKEGNFLFKKIESNFELLNKEKEMLDDLSFEILPDLGSAYLFNSKTLHYSEVNKTNLTRISIDFRIANLDDNTSSKNLSDYYKIKGKLFKNAKDNEFKKCLKYICGGNKKDTTLQHVIINNYAKRNNMIIIDQEAEIERFDYPMIKKHLFSDTINRNYDCILISSQSIIKEALADLKKFKPKVKILSCLNDKFVF